MVATESLADVHASVKSNHPFSRELEPEAIIVITVPVAIVGFVIALTLLFAFYRRKVTLPHLIGVIVWASQLTVALVAWGVTYTSARSIIEDQHLRVLVDEGVIAGNTIQSELTAGFRLGEHMRDLHMSDDFYSMFAPYPQPLVAMRLTLRTFSDLITTLSAPMFGTVDGTFYALRVINGTMMGWHTTPAPGSVPLGVKCAKVDHGAECGAIAASGGCNRSDGLDPLRSCFESCLPPSSPPWDADYCTGTDSLVLGMDLPVSDVVVVNGTRVVVPLITETTAFPYDPRVRPWFLTTPVCQWTAPYIFASTGGTGISMSCGVHNADGTHEGAVGTSFAFTSLNTFLRNLLPHDDAVVLLITKEYSLVSSSMTSTELQLDSGSDLSKEVPVVQNFHPDSRVRHIVQSIARDDNRIFQDAFTHTEALSGDGELILHRPVELPGNLTLLLIVAYPMEDATGEVSTAALTALVAAILISVVISPLALLLVWSMLRPLKQLASDMGDVAEMHLDAHADETTKSRIAEVAGMQHSFLIMVQNLIEFRQYLPQTLLQDQPDANHYTYTGPAAPPPGLATLKAAIVFTDIRASTAIWEAAPDAMKKALFVHNAKIRESFGKCSGYEVKTIGDAFMVAFESTVHALTFGSSVHIALHAAEWPPGLQDVPICVRNKVWGGLTIRVGVNYGEVAPERNDLTGRVDYFGHTVNVASRLESTCKPGAVLVPTELWLQAKDEVTGVVTEDERGVMLKGVAVGLDVTNVWPASLAARRLQPLATRLPERRSVLSTYSEASLRSATNIKGSSLQTARSTMAVVQHCSGLEDLSVGLSVNQSLQSLTTAMERNGGTLLTVLGSYAAVGWNMSRPLANHEESGLRFAAMLRRNIGKLMSAGMISCTLQHGDVGSSLQRFMTVVGPVRTAWKLADMAQTNCRACLYVHLLNGATTPFDDLPTALKGHLELSALTEEHGLPKCITELLQLADSHVMDMSKSEKPQSPDNFGV